MIWQLKGDFAVEHQLHVTSLHSSFSHQNFSFSRSPFLSQTRIYRKKMIYGLAIAIMHFTFLRSNETGNVHLLRWYHPEGRAKLLKASSKHKQKLKWASKLSNISNRNETKSLRTYRRVYFQIIINNNFFRLLDLFSLLSSAQEK